MRPARAVRRLRCRILTVVLLVVLLQLVPPRAAVLTVRALERLVVQVYPLVAHQVAALDERPPAHGTHMRPHRRVGPRVGLKLAPLGRHVRAARKLAAEHVPGVQATVRDEMGLVLGRKTAHVTQVGPVCTVALEVLLERALECERAAAVVAAKRAFSSVAPHVGDQVRLLTAAVVARATAERPLVSVLHPVQQEQLDPLALVRARVAAERR
uniref:Putative secreted protein n=1 Tax=Ixodes ricinus TaxID=34613 RepID=A0A6B0V2B2_IXORI